MIDRNKCVCGVPRDEINAEAKDASRADVTNLCDMYFHPYPGLLDVVYGVVHGEYSEWEVRDGDTHLLGDDDVKLGMRYIYGKGEVLDLTPLERWATLDQEAKSIRNVHMLTKEQLKRLEEIDREL
jgi:hypothetical protein